MTRKIILMVVVMVFAAIVFSQRVRLVDIWRSWTTPAVPEAVSFEVAVLPKSEEKKENKAEQTKTEENRDTITPAELNLAVPFTSQAPKGDWKLPFKETCEEASVFMVAEFYQGTREGKLDVQASTEAIEKIMAFETELFGFYEDTSVAQTAEFAEKLYGYPLSILMKNPTVEQIKQELTLGHPVIVPLAGQELGNPFYTPPGPLYHMLVIRGYTKDGKFITNDPGTKRGEAYLYSFETILDAIHDWDGSGDILKGKKVVLVLNPEK